jgi:hypothetical protein
MRLQTDEGVPILWPWRASRWVVPRHPTVPNRSSLPGRPLEAGHAERARRAETSATTSGVVRARLIGRFS